MGRKGNGGEEREKVTSMGFFLGFMSSGKLEKKSFLLEQVLVPYHSLGKYMLRISESWCTVGSAYLILKEPVPPLTHRFLILVGCPTSEPFRYRILGPSRIVCSLPQVPTCHSKAYK